MRDMYLLGGGGIPKLRLVPMEGLTDTHPIFPFVGRGRRDTLSSGCPCVDKKHLPCPNPHQTLLGKASQLNDSCISVNNCTKSSCKKLEQSLMTERCITGTQGLGYTPLIN